MSAKVERKEVDKSQLKGTPIIWIMGKENKPVDSTEKELPILQADPAPARAPSARTSKSSSRMSTSPLGTFSGPMSCLGAPGANSCINW